MVNKLQVGRELLDTTWRMLVPVLFFAGFGILLDVTLHSGPWLTLLGTCIGFFFAVQLVKKQIDRSNRDNNGDGGV